jgi:hypothetical protein
MIETTKEKIKLVRVFDQGGKDARRLFSLRYADETETSYVVLKDDRILGKKYIDSEIESSRAHGVFRTMNNGKMYADFPLNGGSFEVIDV